jgi:signal transduction histidine kinase
MSRIEKQKLQLEKTPVDLRTIIADAVEAKRHQIESHHQTLVTEFGSDPIRMEVDPLRVAQVIANLVENATKYTPDGGQITVRMATTAGDVHITVQDTGKGLPAEELTNIFDPFRQLDESSHARHGGLGLGLPLVRSLTELHGGTVYATSAGVGHGSCFTIRLPRVPRLDGRRPSS